MKDQYHHPSESLFDAGGHLNEEGVAFYAEHLAAERLEALPKNILLHVQECEQCKMNCLETAEIIRTEQAAESEGRAGGGTLAEERAVVYGSDSDSGRSRWGRPLKYAAVVVVIAGLGTVILMNINVMRRERTERVIGMNDTMEKGRPGGGGTVQEKTLAIRVHEWTQKYPQYSQQFQPNADLEKIMHLTFRSEQVFVEQPDSISEYTTPEKVEFRFSKDTRIIFTLRLIDRDGKLIHQRRMKHQESYVIPKQLRPGLYYWFIDQDTRTLACGRIAVLPHQ